MKGQGISGAGWRCVEAAAGLLAPLEREVVLGDLAEMDCGAWRGLGDVLGLVGAAAACAMEELAAVGGELRAGATGKPIPDGLVGCGERGCCQPFEEPTQARLLWLSLSRLFLVISWAWMAGFVVGAVVAGHAMGQRAGVLCALSVLPVEVAWARALQYETDDLCASGTVGSVARAAGSAAWPGLGGLSGGNGYACAHCVGQGRMDARLLAVMAGFIPDGDGAAEARVNGEN